MSERTDKNGGEVAVREGLAASHFGPDRRALKLADTRLKLKDRGHVEATLAALNAAERSAAVAAKVAKWIFWAVAAAAVTAISLMHALIPPSEDLCKQSWSLPVIKPIRLAQEMLVGVALHQKGRQEFRAEIDEKALFAALPKKWVEGGVGFPRIHGHIR
jgi:hypothetical protein